MLTLLFPESYRLNTSFMIEISLIYLQPARFEASAPKFCCYLYNKVVNDLQWTALAGCSISAESDMLQPLKPAETAEVRSNAGIQGPGNERRGRCEVVTGRVQARDRGFACTR
jgi:hypothetical protein